MSRFIRTLAVATAAGGLALSGLLTAAGAASASTSPGTTGPGTWSFDLFEVRDLWFRCHYVSVVMHIESRRILLAAATTSPSADWLAHKLPADQG